MAHGVTPRPLREADRESWLALWRDYLAFYRAPLTDALVDATFARLCAGDDGLVGLVAAGDDDVPVGLAHLSFHATTWSVSSDCYLEDLYVAPAQRGTGVARALLDAVMRRAEAQGAWRVYWHTQQFNAPARSLYDSVASLTSFIVYERTLDAA